MNWLIFIHLYLWKNSIRRWWEQPLTLLSKLVVAGLLGVLGAFVILGIKELGAQLDSRLNDREVLTATISETLTREQAVSRLETGITLDSFWSSLGGDAETFYQGGGYAKMDNGGDLVIAGVVNMEELGLVDDYYVVSNAFPVGRRYEFEIGKFRSEARVMRPTEEMALILQGRNALLGSVRRMAGVFSRGYSETTIFRADSVDDLRAADSVVEALVNIEKRRIFMRSNLRILQELEKIRAIQSQALLWVGFGSSVVLGLVFGSLAWMEFREERYLLALIRSFGVGKLSLLAHSLVENCILAVGGVMLGFLCLKFFTSMMNLQALKLDWLGSTDSLFTGDGLVLICGAALGGLLSGVPIAIGLRKPLGLVLT